MREMKVWDVVLDSSTDRYVYKHRFTGEVKPIIPRRVMDQPAIPSASAATGGRPRREPCDGKAPLLSLACKKILLALQAGCYRPSQVEVETRLAPSTVRANLIRLRESGAVEYQLVNQSRAVITITMKGRIMLEKERLSEY